MNRVKVSMTAGVAGLGLLVAGSAAAADFEFVHASLNPEGHIDFPVNQDFVNRVEELSDGRITFRMFPGGVLGDEREMIEQMAAGTITTARITPAALSSLCNGMSALNLPFLFDTPEELLSAVESDAFAAICDDILINEGLRPLGYWWMGVRDVYTNDPVTNVDDVQGMKIRTWQDPYVVQAWEALGAIPTPISFGELYTSLQTGVVDGGEGWAASYNANSFYEVAPHLTPLGYIHIASTVLISEQAWQQLPEDLQDIVREAAAENADFAFETFMAEQDTIYETSAELATVHELEDPEAWREATAGVIDAFADDHPGEIADFVRSIAGGN